MCLFFLLLYKVRIILEGVWLKREIKLKRKWSASSTIGNNVFVIWVFISYKVMNTEMKMFLVQELQCGSYQIKGI